MKALCLNIFFAVMVMQVISCVVRDPIQMKTMPLRLVAIVTLQYASGDHLTLEWESLDGKIKIETQEPLEDSNTYRTGMIFSRCFLPR